MKLRQKLAVGGTAMAALLFGSGAMAATMNLAYTYGNVHKECAESSQGGVMLDKNPATTGETCWVDVPLPVEPGHIVQQVNVFYGTDGSTSDIRASVEFKDLHAAKINNSFNGVELFNFSSSVNVSAGGMAQGNLMGQSSTGIIYPDAFEVDPNYAYFVRVALRNGSELFGLRVTYQ